MRRTILLTALFLLIAGSAFSQDNDKKRNGIDKDECTYTKNGKTFPLYGKWEIVEAFPDIKIQIVDAFPDLEIKVVQAFPDDCGEVKFVDAFPDVKVQIVEAFPDIKVKFVEAFPGLK